MNHIYRKSIFLLLVSVAGFFSAHAQSDLPGIETIDGNAMLKTVELLASPAMEGRQPGSPGYEKAVNYTVQLFDSLGLKSLGSEGFLQKVPSEYVEIKDTPGLEWVVGKTVQKKYTLGTDFVCRGLTGFADVSAPVVFCGYGISEPNSGYDDYAGIDVKGKIVMVFKHNPGWTLKDVDFSDKFNRYRANVAAAHGAVGILLVSTPLAKDPQKLIGSLMDGDGKYDVHMPQLHISIETANEFLSGSNFSLKQLQKQIDSLKRPNSLALKNNAHILVKGEYFPVWSSSNVVAMLEGSDPGLKDHYLVIGAHLDHVGKQGKGLYFPGANDNASGSAAVMQLAATFVKSGLMPRMSVIFVLYTGEEQGMLGSNYFAEHCPVPVDKIDAAFNLDCIGHGDSIEVRGGKSFPVLWNIARTQDSLHAGRMIKTTYRGGGADLEALFSKNVPGIYFVSHYSYTHLHLPSDTPETLNVALYQELVRLVYRTARIVTNGEYTREDVLK